MSMIKSFKIKDQAVRKNLNIKAITMQYIGKNIPVPEYIYMAGDQIVEVGHHRRAAAVTH